MAEGGTAALSARALAAEAGMSLGAAYHLFRDLEALVVEVNARTFDRLAEALAAVPVTGEPEGDLVALADAYLAFVSANPRLWDAVFVLPIRGPDDNPNAPRVERMLRALDAALLPALPDDPDAARRSARILWGAVHGLVSLSVTGRMGTVGVADLRAGLRHLVACHLAGLRAGAGR